MPSRCFPHPAGQPGLQAAEVSGCLSLGREPYLLMCLQEWHPSNFPQIHAHRIVGDFYWSLALGIQFLFLNFLQFVGRGPTKRLAVNAESGLAGADAEVTDQAVSACPVGALLHKRVGYKVPIGQRKYDHEPIGSDIETRRFVNTE